MAFLSIDTWTGGNDTDIAGRTPDGGRNGEYTNGTWDEHGDYTAGRIDIVSGVARGALTTDTGYVLTGLSTGADYRVEGIFERLTDDAGATIGIGARSNNVSQASHYIFLYTQVSGFTQAYVEIWWQTDWFNSGFLGGHNISMPAIGVPVTLALEVEGTALRAYVNDVLEIDVTDSGIAASGYPLLWFNGDSGGATPAWESTEFNVQTLCDAIPAVTWELVSEDAFTGGDDTDIAGRTPDGDGNGTYAVGTWDEHDTYPTGKIEIVSGTIRGFSTSNNIYLLKDLDLTENYRTEATFTRIDQIPSAFSAWVAIGLRTGESPNNQIFFMYWQDSELWSTGPDVYTAWVEVYWQTATEYGWIGGTRIPLVAPDTPVTLALEVYGSTIRAFVDDEQVIYGCGNVASAIGSPSIWIRNRAGPTQPTWQGLNYKVLKESGGAPPAGSARAFAAWI